MTLRVLGYRRNKGRAAEVTAAAYAAASDRPDASGGSQASPISREDSAELPPEGRHAATEAGFTDSEPLAAGSRPEHPRPSACGFGCPGRGAFALNPLEHAT